MLKKNKVFIDSNIPIYAAGTKHPNKASSIKILESVSENKINGVTILLLRMINSLKYSGI